MEQERSEWTCVFVGEPWEAVSAQVKLEAYGVDAFVPDSSMKTIDPFVTGANALSSRVLVPTPVAERALEVLGDREGEEALELDGQGEEDDEPVAVDDPLVRLGRRIRWCGLLGSFPPFAIYGLYLSTRYVSEVRGSEPKPRGHGWTLAAAVLTLIWTMVAVLAARLIMSG